ncbi:MAG: DUF1684 domain-containing protein [Flavobacteriales bacterium]|nr:DUF1684 domain-containing protein [Flavobacteriales bacterium]
MRSLGLVWALLLTAAVQAQDAWRDSLEAYWERINAAYRDTAHSPLKPEDRAVFTALERFPIDPAYRVQARFKPAKSPVPFTMRTTTQRQPVYVAYGTLEFKLNGRKCRLTVYRDAVPRPGLETHLFLPFTDATNGEETYGGGRYMDLAAPLGATVELDFNRAYNPYCAYGGRYSCPIPPKENHLPVAVRAGVLKFHD